MNRRLFVCAVTLVLCSILARGVHAQTSPAEQLEIKKEELVQRLEAAKAAGSLTPKSTELSPGGNIELYTLSFAFSRQGADAMARDAAELRKVIEAARVDKQLGSDSSSSGSTSVTEKGAVPRILGFAVENGALIKTQSGTTISFKANPDGIVRALAGTPLVRGPWSRIAFGLAFDASRGAAEGQPAVFVGDRQQLSEFNAKYEFLNHRDPASAQFQSRVDDLYARVRKTAIGNQKLLVFEGSMTKALVVDHKSEFDNWNATALAELQKAFTREELMEILNRQLTILYESLSFTAVDRRDLDEYIATYKSFLSSRDALLELAGKGAVMSVEFAHSRPVDQPTESTIKWMYEWSAVNGKVDLTANASTTFLNGTLSDGIQRWKAWAVAGQLDVPLGSIVQGRSLVFTLSGLAEGRVLPPANDRETIWLGQLKLTFPVKDAGVKLPLSVTVANRTDLVDEKVVRGNIGLTFNLDALVGGLR